MMKLTKLNLLLAGGLVLLLSTPAQSQFVKILGGIHSHEVGESMIQTSDGAIVVVGKTSGLGPGSYDVLLAKFNTSGDLLWSKTVGGDGNEFGLSLAETSDRGLVVTGWTESFGAGNRDVLLAKLDSLGNLLWARTLGGVESEEGICVIQSSDGTLVVAGFTYSYGAGGADLLLARFDSLGNLLWMKTLGGTSNDMDYHCSVVEASDGGLVAAGRTYSFGSRVLLTKFDTSGNHLWTKTIGGSDPDQGYSVIEVFDGGLVVTGSSRSFGTGEGDLFLIKCDGSGNLMWASVLGGESADWGMSVTETSDKKLVVPGMTTSFGPSGYDLLLACFDSTGNHLWARWLGGTSQDVGYSAIETSDGALVMTGYVRHFGPHNFDDLILATFDAWGNTCLGEFVTPYFDIVYPTVDSVSPAVGSPTPDTGTCVLTVTDPTPRLELVCQVKPVLVSIADVGNDQGRQVRVGWDRCYWDEAGSPVIITEYGVWRRIDEDKGSHLADLGVFDGGRVYPPGDWDFIKTIPARGEEEYSTICPTLGDSTKREGMYWSVFFVSAMTSDPLVYFDSDPDSGYSLDNIPPVPIEDLEIDPGSWFTLQWTVPGEYEEEEPISAYYIRYSTDPVGADTQTWWDNSQACTGEGFFKLTVGEKDSFRVAGETGCHPELYFAVKGLDDRPNASGISNVVHFLCGDDNGDGIVNVGDVVYEVCYLFRNGPAPSPRAAGDVNCDGIENVGDIVYKVSYLYRGGPPPCGL